LRRLDRAYLCLAEVVTQGPMKIQGRKVHRVNTQAGHSAGQLLHQLGEIFNRSHKNNAGV